MWCDSIKRVLSSHLSVRPLGTTVRLAEADRHNPNLFRVVE